MLIEREFEQIDSNRFVAYGKVLEVIDQTPTIKSLTVLTEGKYPQKISLTVTEKYFPILNKIGKRNAFTFSISSYEYQIQRYMTNFRCFKIDNLDYLEYENLTKNLPTAEEAFGTEKIHTKEPEIKNHSMLCPNCGYTVSEQNNYKLPSHQIQYDDDLPF